MMANHLFRNYLKNTERILSIAMGMLEKHITDQAVTEDNTDIIQQKKEEIAKLKKRLGNLISMRADGEIDKEQFLSMKADIEAQVHTLQEQIKDLSPYESDEEYEEPDYEKKITLLRYALERYVDFSSDEDIPEAVIEAFVEKIVVNEDSFDWYLRFTGGDDSPTKCNVKGRRNSAEIELFSSAETPSIAESNTGRNR